MNRGPRHRPRRRPRRLITIVLVAIIAVVAASVVGYRALTASTAADAALTQAAVVTASSSALGHPARAAVDSDTGAAGWQPSARPVGAWLRFDWQVERTVTRIHLEQPAGANHVTTVLAAFGDGSRVLAAIRGVRSEIDFAPRKVRSVKLTVVSTASASGSIAVSGVRLSASTTDRTPDERRSMAVGVAAEARASSTGAGSADANRSLTDGRSAGDLGSDWTSARAGSASVTLVWDRPHEISSVQLFGVGGSSGSIARGAVEFDGATPVQLGAVLGDAGRPTEVAFVPRVVRTLTIRLIGATADARIRLAELRAFTTGTTPSIPATGPDLPRATPESSSCSAGTRYTVGGVAFSVLCPSAGAAVQGRTSMIVAAPAAGAAVSAQVWSNNGRIVRAQAVHFIDDARRTVAIDLDMTGVSPGPVTVELRAAGVADPIYFPLYNSENGAVRASVPSASPLGGRLVYDEEFNGAVSASYDGSTGTYVAAKPEAAGVSQFGEAPFADPRSKSGTLDIVDSRYLRVAVRPRDEESGAAGTGALLGGMLASARPGGSGFSAQYGYFEARMYLPIAAGSWPAFWMLPSANLAKPQQDVAEIDAMEFYGHDPVGTCSSTHQYTGGTGTGGVALCARRFTSPQVSAAWHTYGVRIDPTVITFYIDGRQIATAPQVKGGGDAMFFLADLALGGGWPVDLAATGGHLQMYVDYVRVYA